MPWIGSFFPTHLSPATAWATRLVAGVLFLSACGGSDLVLPGGGEASAIRVVQGDGESGQMGDLVPLVVEVTDARGQPIEGASVAFDLTSGGVGAAIAPAAATTDAVGQAHAQMLLGNQAGLQTGDASLVMGGTPPKASFGVLVLSDNPGNQAPRADYSSHCENLSCEFTDASSDSDGSVTGWNWSFGDGGTSSIRDPAHIYQIAGIYTVTLTVTDNDGAMDVTQTNVTVSAPVPPANKAPRAEFEVHCSTSTCAFIDTSTDEDGQIVGWLWNFGDGSPTSTERNPAHTYDGKGHFQVTLTVTDDGGAVDIKSHNADPKK